MDICFYLALYHPVSEFLLLAENDSARLFISPSLHGLDSLGRTLPHNITGCGITSAK